MSAFTNIIDNDHPTVTSCGEVADIMQPLRKLGIAYFCYTRVDHAGSHLTLESFPTSQQFYNGKLYKHGTTSCNGSIYKNSIIYWDTMKDQTVINKLGRANGFDHGMLFIQPRITDCEFYNFATTHGNEQIINVYLNKLDVFKKFTDYFKEQAAPLIKLLEKNKIYVPTRKDVIAVNQIAELNNTPIIFKSQSRNYMFTERQVDIINCLMKGYNIKYTASYLQLSPRTVESYINILKNKLQCRNKAELLIKLVAVMKVH